MVKVLRDDLKADSPPDPPDAYGIGYTTLAWSQDGDRRIDPARGEVYANIGRIFDHCWKRGVFYSLSFETYNIGGGGTPASFLEQHPEAIAINALGEKARDHECTVSDGKLIPSVYHPA